MVVHTCNPSTWEAETGRLQVQSQPQQFSKTLSNLARSYFKKINMAHACNPNTWGAETEGSQVQSQPQQFSKTLSKLARLCFK